MPTSAAVHLKLDREALSGWYRRNRVRSAQLFGLVDPQAYYSRPIPLRHPFAFYEGHLPAFSFLVLNERALGETPLDADIERLFERGIDPASADEAKSHDPHGWPSRDAIGAFGRACDERVLEAIANAKLEDPDVPRLARGQAVYTLLEHEQMHHETLLYLVHQLDRTSKRRLPQQHRDSSPPGNDFVDVPAGIATLGAQRETAQFGWDNEFEAHERNVGAFSIQRYPVTNADYLHFVKQGGPVPPFWIEHDGEFALRAQFDELPLPLSWPVYVRHQDATAYAAWKGWRLPSEAEYQRAAFGTPSGDERAYPWGDQTPQPLHGNFGFARFDPEPVDAHPAGASAWAIHDLVGNGWEWTATPFGPFEGFEPMAS